MKLTNKMDVELESSEVMEGDNCSRGDSEPYSSIKEAIEREVGRMEKLSGEIREDVSTVKNQMKYRFDSLEHHFECLQERIVNLESSSKEAVAASSSSSLEACDEYNSCPGRGQNNINTSGSESRIYDRSSNNCTTTPVNGGVLKMKPHAYDGTDDLDEYLVQFNILAEINGWNYHMKSLYLAGSLTGSARALLNDMNIESRRDFNSLLVALNNRFGSENKAEIFRSKLQNRVRGKNETLPELAQSIKKMTRKAYPKAKADVTDVIALDYFIDAIVDAEIRLRLREVGPRDINEAEQIAVRLETFRLADRQRNKTVRTVDADLNLKPENKNSALETQMNEIMKTVQDLAKTVKEMRSDTKTGSNNRNENFGADKWGNKPPFREQRSWRNKPNRGGFQNNRGSYREQGNGSRSGPRAPTRPFNQGPVH